MKIEMMMIEYRCIGVDNYNDNVSYDDLDVTDVLMMIVMMTMMVIIMIMTVYRWCLNY